ncbi:hypothetical protein C9F11_38515 [Streptomyces sp. YIM 121038]|uniref:hypothetical protein n=1 Tax=Streptomyces sp. YIM 121038 TaxID=2136401 RepID=UPI0011642847|nr:hypothetical protein [Streptomyces sp. YIM 121038]QCX81286.1 hypothetical protein C9F11_38515 [Streptomyces sp. YIM 121038]
MATSGPQRYPGASTSYWYGSRYPGSAMEVNVIVWHSTEGTSLPTYGNGASAPNFTAKPDFAAKRLVWYQHFDFDESSRALVNRAGGVETNTLNACQVEIVGTCDPTTHGKWERAGYLHLYTPDLPSWAIRDLGAFARWAHEQHGVPLTSGLAFKAYPSSYGTNGVRMSGPQWTAFKGHCGHQHVPENDHGDPGAFPMAAVLTAAKGGTTPPREDDVPLTKADVNTIFNTDNVIAVPPDWSPDNAYWTAASVLVDQGKRLRALDKKLDALTAANTKLVDAVAQLAAGIGDLDPASIVAELRAAIESIEIHLDVPDA